MASSRVEPGPAGASSSDSVVSDDRLLRAWQTASESLLAERNAQGYWEGELSSSALSTATAVSALSIAEQHAASLRCAGRDEAENASADAWDSSYQIDLSELICKSLRWLAEQQNEDGGWGDTDRSESNLATTLLVLSAFRLTGVPAQFADLEPRAEQYVRKQGGVAGLKKRYGRDKTFAAPILANCALAGVVPWRQVPTLPFELAALPQSWFRRVGMPVVSYAIPALIAIGLVKHEQRPSLNPVASWLRRRVTGRCLEVLQRMQPDSGGYLEATPLTSFVVMALAGAGRPDHPVVRRGVEFLLASVRADGSWPIDTNLATWNTTLAVNALNKGGSRNAERGDHAEFDGVSTPQATIDWLLACQHTERHPFTGADPGGWAWTNLSGGVPDADDTAGALLTLHNQWATAEGADRTRIAMAVSRGVRWLLELQNRDGGWPTFCRGWGKLPFDRSATDLSSHVLRALHAWRHTRGWWTPAEHGENRPAGRKPMLSTADLDGRIDHAIVDGLDYLDREQRADGSWAPLWFGRESRPDQTNPVFGTSRVLLALADVARADSPIARRGLEWIVRQQHANGGWGSDPSNSEVEAEYSLEETAVAVEALAKWSVIERPTTHATTTDATIRRSLDAGVAWLVSKIEHEATAAAAPIGLYFAKLWYYERLYPKSFTVSALGSVLHSRNLGGLSVRTVQVDEPSPPSSRTRVLA